MPGFWPWWADYGYPYYGYGDYSGRSILTGTTADWARTWEAPRPRLRVTMERVCGLCGRAGRSRSGARSTLGEADGNPVGQQFLSTPATRSASTSMKRRCGWPITRAWRCRASQAARVDGAGVVRLEGLSRREPGVAHGRGDGSAERLARAYAYYGDLPTYTRQLDALAQYIGEHPSAADARFVLAYHDLMMGHSGPAAAELEKVWAPCPRTGWQKTC